MFVIIFIVTIIFRIVLLISELFLILLIHIYNLLLLHHIKHLVLGLHLLVLILLDLSVLEFSISLN